MKNITLLHVVFVSSSLLALAPGDPDMIGLSFELLMNLGLGLVTGTNHWQPLVSSSDHQSTFFELLLELVV